MARRNIENYRSSIQQIAPQEGIENPSNLISQAAEIGQQIIKSNQEAKITENFSKVQLDLNRLNTQYQIDNENDPFGGLKDLKQKRDELFSSYGNDISPFFKGSWQSSTRDLGFKDDAEMETWAYAQTKKNTVRSINATIKNNMSQATVDGQNFGTSDTDEIGSMLNYGASKKNLALFGDKNLGAGTTTELLESYDDDYLKSFIGGVSDTNPIKALRLMEDKNVQKSFRDKGQYLKMKEAVETKALQADKIYTQKEVLNVLKDENSILGKSLKENISYVELQKEFSTKKISQSAQDYFLKANGFRSEKGEEKLSKSEKLKEQVALYDAIQVAASEEDLTPEAISSLQDRVYKAMDRGVLDGQDGAEYINQFINPLVAGKEEQLSKYQAGNWNPLQDNIGYNQLNDLLEEVTVTPPELDDRPSEGERASISSVENVNNEKKLKLYNFYNDQLRKEADTRGMAIGDLPNLSYSEKKEIYNKAQTKAKKLYLSDEYPELGNLKDDEWPDSIITNDGRKIKTGVASPKVTGSVIAPNPQYEFATEAEMESANLPDGTPVMLNGVAGIYRK